MLSGNRIKGGKYKVKKKNKDKSMRTHLREPAYVSVVLWGCEIILLTEHNFNSDCDCINYRCYYKGFFNALWKLALDSLKVLVPFVLGYRNTYYKSRKGRARGKEITKGLVMLEVVGIRKGSLGFRKQLLQ